MKYFILIAISLVLTTATIAQDFEASPVMLDFNAEPGETQSKYMVIRNHNDEKTSFILTIKDFSQDEEGKNIYSEANTTRYSCAQWLSINPAFFDLEPNEEKQVLINMQPPLGDYSTRWATIFVSTAQEQTASNISDNLATGIRLSGQIAVRVIQSPSSNTTYGATINNLKEIEPVDEKHRLFNATVENTGEKIIDCKVFLLANDLSTGKEYQYSVLRIKVYPGNKRLVKLQLPNSLPKGKYSLAAICDYGGRFSLEGTQILIEH